MQASTASPGALESPTSSVQPRLIPVCVRCFVAAATKFSVVRSGHGPVTRSDDFAVPSKASHGLVQANAMMHPLRTLG